MPHAATPLRREVAFLSDGATCRAWLYEPAADVPPPSPCIVMAHGLGGTRDASLSPYAGRFAAAGFYVLVFDYRHLGDSDGEPRQLISMERQLADWGAAIAFARAIPGVDAQRIGLWGCSLAGGHVLVAAARDKRIAAVAAQCPMLDGAASARMAVKQAGLAMSMRMAGAALLDVARACMRKAPHYVPLAAAPGSLAAMATEDAYAECMAIVPPGWRNEVAARLFFAMPCYRPSRYACDVSCPTLLIACAQDTVTSTKAVEQTAARMGNRAQLITLPIGHFDIYLGKWLERSIGEQLTFFKKTFAAPCTFVKAR
jgi:pimeloyl-ACP methyl ester carboxylesterase